MTLGRRPDHARPSTLSPACFKKHLHLNPIVAAQILKVPYNKFNGDSEYINNPMILLTPHIIDYSL